MHSISTARFRLFRLAASECSQVENRSISGKIADFLPSLPPRFSPSDLLIIPLCPKTAEPNFSNLYPRDIFKSKSIPLVRISFANFPFPSLRAAATITTIPTDIIAIIIRMEQRYRSRARPLLRFTNATSGVREERIQEQWAIINLRVRKRGLSTGVTTYGDKTRRRVARRSWPEEARALVFIPMPQPPACIFSATRYSRSSTLVTDTTIRTNLRIIPLSLSSLFGPSLPEDNYAWSEGEGSVRYRRIIPGTVANKNDWNGCAWIRFGGGARGRGRISTIWSRSCLSTLPLSRSVEL